MLTVSENAPVDRPHLALTPLHKRNDHRSRVYCCQHPIIRGQQRIGGRLSFRKLSAISPCRPFHARPLTQSYLIRSNNKAAATAARQEGGAGALLRGAILWFWDSSTGSLLSLCAVKTPESTTSSARSVGTRRRQGPGRQADYQ